MPRTKGVTVEKLKVGEKFVNTKGLTYEVVEYVSWCDVTIKFETSGFVRKTTSRLTRSGVVDDISHFPQVGSIHRNKFGTEFQILEYNGARDVKIMFLDEFKHVKSTKTLYVQTGGIRNPFDRTVFGIGYLGIGPYVGKVNGENTKIYSTWSSIFNRCYSAHLGKSASYKNSKVLESFQCFQDFATWSENQIGSKEEGWHLDKDIINRGNKDYGPDVCAFVPQEINTMIISCNASRGALPVGVSKSKSGKRFSAAAHMGLKDKHIGSFSTPEEAFYAYKEAKEDYIKSVAEKWRDKIDVRVYNSLMNWNIEITD